MQLNQQQNFSEIVLMIRQAQYNAAKTVNKEMINLYWNIGQYISNQLDTAKWGESVVKELAVYLARNEPDLKGFSDKNLWRMKQFYETYKDFPKLSPLVREISWTNIGYRLAIVIFISTCCFSTGGYNAL